MVQQDRIDRLRAAGFDHCRISALATENLRKSGAICSCGNGPNHAPDCALVFAMEEAWDDAVGQSEEELAEALDAQEAEGYR